jgi:alpha-glucosidase
MSQTDSRQSPSLRAQNPATNPADSNAALPWWHGAAIYQIYPRSFADSNGDGIGDLAGITARLDHVARLGADAIWISPFFTSPMRDFGYDVADYCDVDPVFGTLADFDALVARAHDLGLKVTIDQVYAHTSDQHPWFVASRQSRDNPYADWYVWEDPKPDGSPPSNWQSVFGGPAWRWDARRCQYYLHNFLAEQPQVNAHNPAVQQAILDVMRFWLDRGVDGFRIDALNFLMHEPSLRDNPPAPDDGRRRTRPFDYQLKLYNQSHADIVPFVERLRAVRQLWRDLHRRRSGRRSGRTGNEGLYRRVHPPQQRLWLRLPLCRPDHPGHGARRARPLARRTGHGLAQLGV